MRSKPRVLIVDDEENLCVLYKEELEADGYEVTAVRDPGAALRLISRDSPDVVVMDIRMPAMDGIEAMGRMLGIRRDLPVILNTAYSCYKDDFLTWPARAYVIKSSDLGDLKRALHDVLSPCQAA